MYQLTQTDVIIRTTDSANIPPDPANSDYAAYLTWVGLGNTPEPYDVPEAPVPQEVSIRQGCLALEAAELLDDVELIVATLPRPYQIEWQRASVIRRDNPLVEVVRQQQGLTVEAIDQLFINASNY